MLALPSSFHTKHSQPISDFSALCEKLGKGTGPEGDSISTKWIWALDQTSGLGFIARYRPILLVLPYDFHMFEKMALELFSFMFTAIYKYYSCMMKVIDFIIGAVLKKEKNIICTTVSKKNY